MSKEMSKIHSKNQRIEALPSVEEKIRSRAYEIYEARGREDGHDLDDWVRAETEVTGVALQPYTA